VRADAPSRSPRTRSAQGGSRSDFLVAPSGAINSLPRKEIPARFPLCAGAGTLDAIAPGNTTLSQTPKETMMKRSDAENAMVAAASMAKPMKRSDVTDLIAFRKIKLGIKWSEVAKKVGESKEWVTAACLGQMQMTKKQAETVGRIFDLPEEAVLILQTVPYKGSLPTAVPTDPLIYRLYEIVNVYGTTIKELIHEEFGDGIMSAIDFSMDLSREPHEKGDRVHVVMSGKYLPYKTY
jgi:cyanate lyase